MKWFGESWGAAVNQFCERAATPVGADCARCGLPIAADCQGVLVPSASAPASEAAWHRGCFLDECGINPATLEGYSQAVAESPSFRDSVRRARPAHYRLCGQTPVPCDDGDLIGWALWFGSADRQVARTRLPWCEVSTVFLGTDHNFRLAGEPILFESMAFWPDGSAEEQDRCSTWLQAERMHQRIIEEVSSLASIAMYALRHISSMVRDARRDWRVSWKELRGVPPTEMDDMWQRIREAA